jgi:hypothetical protein
MVCAFLTALRSDLYFSAHWINKHVADQIYPVALRALKTILGHPSNEKAGIWSFGCVVRLMDIVPSSQLGLNYIADVLLMMRIKGQPIYCSHLWNYT